jgi:AcrR family transcriptional regulator
MTDAKPPTSPRRKPVRAVKPEGQWHHGNLRESLIQWGTHLLDTEGSEAMSLRATAKLAGVSQGAPAHHFGDKNGLLAAIAAQGFRDLVAQRQRRLATVDAADGPGQLRVVLLAYIDFAHAHPARFQLMFGPLLGRRDDYPELIEAGTASFALLRSVVLPLLPSPRSDVLSEDELAHIIWAAVHGLATLRMHGRGAPVRTGPRQSTAQVGDALVRFCLLAIAGLAAPTT